MTPTLRSRSRSVTPVFVDGSGRRLRRARIALFAAAGLAAAYVVLVVVSLFGVPTIASPLLALPAHPGAVPGSSASPAPSATDRASTAPSVLPATREAASITTTQPSASTSAPAPSATAQPTPSPTPSPTAPGSSALAPGHITTTLPGHSGSAPRRSPSPHP